VFGILISDATLRRYLLGDLSPLARTVVEGSFILRGTVFRKLEFVEDNLIDDYVHDQLTDAQRRQFEQFYLTSERRRAKYAAARDAFLYHCRLGPGVKCGRCAASHPHPTNPCLVMPLRRDAAHNLIWTELAVLLIIVFLNETDWDHWRQRLRRKRCKSAGS
jgi:hypothetical protein